MNANIYNNLIKTTVKSDVNLPNQVFKRDFDSYLFFDASLRSTAGLPTAIKKVIERIRNFPVEAAIFTSIKHDFLTCIDEGYDWETVWKELDNKLYESLIFESFVVVGLKEDWAVFQHYPTDIGIIGLNKNEIPLSLESDDIDFFSCVDIISWLSNDNDQHIEKTNYYGKEFLKILLKNYASKN